MSPLSPSFIPRTLVNIIHEGDLAVTLRLVRSLELSNSLDLEILVTVRGVDTDDRRVLTEGLRGRASILELPGSASDANASNAAFERAVGRDSRFVWLLGAQALIEPWTLGHLMKRLNALPECAAVAPLGRGRGRKRSVDVDALPYAGSLFRVAAWEAVGPFRESDQIHGGDAAWCARVRAAGWRVMRTSPGKPRPPATKRRSEPPTPKEPGRLRGAVGWRLRRLKRRYEDSVRPTSPRRDAYARLLDGNYADGTGPTFVFALEKVRVDTIVGADVLGLALALAEKGHGVQVIPAGSAVPAADVIVAATPQFDPSTGPDEALRIAWVRTDSERWPQLSFLSAYDVVLAGSSLTVRKLARHHPRTQLLRPAVDAELFGGPPSPRRKRRALRADAQKGIARFRLPSLYGRRLVVVDRSSAEVRKQGVVSQRFLEVAASGAVPLTTAMVGVRELGFASVPGARDALPARSALESLGAELRDAVLSEHTFALRAEQLVNEIVPAAERTGPRRCVHVAPFYRGNPYQAMLYAAVGDVDAAVVPVVEITEHLAARAKVVQPGLFHLHWTNPIVQPAESEPEARERLDAFVAAMDAFAAAGGKLIWTIHNVLPHDARYHDLEIEMANEILHHADVVHLLSRETLDLVDGVYDVDQQRVVVVEHSSFAGIYPDWISRDGARERLEIDPADKVLIVVGGIRPYKGIDRMLDILDELVVDDPSLRLLIAGGAGDQPGIAELKARCADHPRVRSQFKHVPNGELQAWFAAADVAVLPYVNILNSSAFQLAPSFGLPVVGPRMGALTAAEDEPYVRLFDPTSTDDLRDVVRDAVRDFVGDDEMRQTARTAAAARPPAAMAEAFARVIDRVLTD